MHSIIEKTMSKSSSALPVKTIASGILSSSTSEKSAFSIVIFFLLSVSLTSVDVWENINDVMQIKNMKKYFNKIKNLDKNKWNDWIIYWFKKILNRKTPKEF